MNQLSRRVAKALLLVERIFGDRKLELRFWVILLWISLAGWTATFLGVGRSISAFSTWNLLWVAACIFIVGVQLLVLSNYGARRLLGLGLAGVVLNFNCLFSFVYLRIGTAENFGTSLSHVDAVYFNLTTFTTTGFGDIEPKTQMARGVVSLHMALTLVLVGVIAATLLSHIASSRVIPSGSSLRSAATPPVDDDEL